MTHGATNGFLLLCLMALGMLLWARLKPRSRRQYAPHMALVALCVAGVAAVTALWAPPFALSGNASTRFDALAAFLALALLGLKWLKRLNDPTTFEIRSWTALQLLGAAGTLLALSSRDLFGMASGLMLYYVAGLVQDEAGRNRLALAILMLPCLALIYAGQGTLDLAILSVQLWQRGGPAPFLTYLGVGLLTAALIGQLWLAADHALSWGQSELVLLCCILLRVRLFAAGAWIWEWHWGLTAVALPLILWGVWQGWRTRRTCGGLIALSRVQIGFVLAAIAISDAPAGLLAAWLGILTLALGYGVLNASFEVLGVSAGRGSSQVPLGLAREHLSLGVPLLVGLFSLAGIAPLPGFWARYAWIAAQRQIMPAAWGWVGLVICLGGGIVYLPWMIALLRRGEPLPAYSPNRQVGLLAWVLVVLLILLGIGAAAAGMRMIGWIIA